MLNDCKWHKYFGNHINSDLEVESKYYPYDHDKQNKEKKLLIVEKGKEW